MNVIHRRNRSGAAGLAVALFCGAGLGGQDETPPTETPPTETPPAEVASADAAPARIAWYGTWKGGAAQAARLGRPILLMSAAPQCHGVPGVW